jgi:hypothetical protein
MNLHSLAASSFVLVGLAALACSSGNDDIMMGSDSASSSAGDKPIGGSGVATGGSKAGGSSSGGTTTGGSSSGGTTTGAGETSGGDSSGGSVTLGGTAGGGASNGGTSAGGTSNGGSTGNPASPCEQDSDCVSCSYGHAPTSAQECYCVTCQSTPMTQEQCAANSTQFSEVCANVALPCPAIKCLPPPEPACVNHSCVAQ